MIVSIFKSRLCIYVFDSKNDSFYIIQNLLILIQITQTCDVFLLKFKFVFSYIQSFVTKSFNICFQNALYSARENI